MVKRHFFDFEYIIRKGGFGKELKMKLKTTKENFALKEQK